MRHGSFDSSDPRSSHTPPQTPPPATVGTRVGVASTASRRTRDHRYSIRTLSTSTHGQTPAVHAPHTPRTLLPPPPGLHLEFGSILQVMSISRNLPRARESLPQRIKARPLLPGPPGAHRRGWEEGEMLGGSAEADREIGPMGTCRSPRRPRHVHAIGMVPAPPTPHALPDPRGWTSTRSGWRA